MTRPWIYTMLIPNLLGLAAVAAIVLPGDGDDLSVTRLLVGWGVMIAVNVGASLVGGRIVRRRT